MSMVDLIVILFHLKLDKFYYIRIMNQLKVMSYYWLNKEKLLQKTNSIHHNCGGKGKTAKHDL